MSLNLIVQEDNFLIRTHYTTYRHSWEEYNSDHVAMVYLSMSSHDNQPSTLSGSLY